MEWSRKAGWTVVLAGMLAMVSIGIAVAQTQAAPAVTVITKFQGTLLSVMKNAKTLGFPGRYRELTPAVRKSHNLAFIAEVTLGPYWTGLTAAQRAQFQKTFTRLTIATYAAEFDGYAAGQAFHVTGSRVLGNGDVIVATELVSAKGRQARLDYLLAPSHGNWQIVNIVANGVSDLALKRAQYTAIMRAQGFPVLLKKLRAKVARLMALHKAA
ncbi:MAG: ABC transporter substrate-binding protein [Gammaproteobacteria bacterium]|nr:ABC transporter substrate-binding protein [Gammaproteobacteria bacterium]